MSKENVQNVREDIFGGKKLNVTGIDPVFNLIDKHRGHIAGAALALAVIVPNEVAHANGLPGTYNSPIEIDITKNNIAAGIGATLGVIKEVLDKEEKGENAIAQCVGNAVLGGVSFWTATDLVQIGLALSSGENVKLEGPLQIIRFIEIPILIGSVYGIVKTTGSTRNNIIDNYHQKQTEKTLQSKQKEFENLLIGFFNGNAQATKKLVNSGFTTYNDRIEYVTDKDITTYRYNNGKISEEFRVKSFFDKIIYPKGNKPTNRD